MNSLLFLRFSFKFDIFIFILGTSWTYKEDFSSFFILPFNSNRFAIISAGSRSVSCTFKPPTDDTGIDVIVTSGQSSLVKNGASTLSWEQGTTIKCTGRVAIVASFGQDEYNLHGLMDEVSVPKLSCLVATLLNGVLKPVWAYTTSQFLNESCILPV